VARGRRGRPAWRGELGGGQGVLGDLKPLVDDSPCRGLADSLGGVASVVEGIEAVVARDVDGAHDDEDGPKSKVNTCQVSTPVASQTPATQHTLLKCVLLVPLVTGVLTCCCSSKSAPQ
jgi:hypothetical protein